MGGIFRMGNIMKTCNQCKYIGNGISGKKACYSKPPLVTLLPMKSALGDVAPAILTYRPEVSGSDKACESFHEEFHTPP